MARRVILTSSGPVILEEQVFQTRSASAKRICEALQPRQQFTPLQGVNYVEDALIARLDFQKARSESRKASERIKRLLETI